MIALYLFDIDGTLLRAGGAGMRALDVVFARRHRIERAMRGIDPGGRTDPWLVAQVFEKRLGRAPSDAEIDAVLDDYVAELERELDTSATLRVLPHVVDALAHLEGCGQIGIGIATGNIERGARIKLERAGLAARFGFGGYGCDSRLVGRSSDEPRPSAGQGEERPAGQSGIRLATLGGGHRARVVARAIERGREKAGACVPERIVVVGDTVHDVTAARACGVRAVAVATGSVRRADLDAAGADAVLDTLAELPAWHDRVLGG